MKFIAAFALSSLCVTPLLAQETRQLDSHEHGVGQLGIAIDGSRVAMEFHAPGADIVGFEYSAESAEDIAKLDAAVMVLAQPFDVFTVPDAAQCSVVEARAELEGGGDDAGEDHDGQGHDDHDDHGHEAEAAGHTEFHAEYLLECGNITALDTLSFPYFTAFPNALEIEVQVVSDRGAAAFEVERDAPVVDLGDLN